MQSSKKKREKEYLKSQILYIILDICPKGRLFFKLVFKFPLPKILVGLHTGRQVCTRTRAHTHPKSAVYIGMHTYIHQYIDIYLYMDIYMKVQERRNVSV